MSDTECLADLRAIDRDEEIWLPELFAARKRGQQAMDLWMAKNSGSIAHLFPTPGRPHDDRLDGPVQP